VAILLNVYQAYYILAGVAGLALYFPVVRICCELLQNYRLNPEVSAGIRDLLIGTVMILACSAEVQFCFSRAAALIRMAA
jgi:hypothetical protein